MAEFDSAERVSTYLEEYDTDVMTGDRDKRMYLYYQLVNSMKRADRIDIIVSFFYGIWCENVAEGSGPGNEERRKDSYSYWKLSGNYAAIRTVSD